MHKDSTGRGPPQYDGKFNLPDVSMPDLIDMLHTLEEDQILILNIFGVNCLL